MISDEELLCFSKEGFWPGPDEPEADFLQRVAATKKQARALSQEAISEKTIIEASTLTEALFDFSCFNIPCFYLDKGLSLWEGAALWIDEADGVSTPHIQLKRKFKKGSYLCYKEKEVVAHEMFHAARIAYQEPKYEEILAYKTSKNSLRRSLGPLFQTPKESYVFIILLLIGFVLEISSTVWEVPFYAPWILLPFLWMGCLGLRLKGRLRKFDHAHAHLKSCLRDPSKALAVLAKLTDKEIEQLAQISPWEISLLFKQKKDLRLRSLVLNFFT